MPVNLNKPFEGRTPLQPDAGGKTTFLPQLVSWYDPTYLEDAIARTSVRTIAVFSKYPPAAINPDLQITVVWKRPDEIVGIGTGSYGTINRSYITDAVNSLAINSVVTFLTVDVISGEAVLVVNSLADFSVKPGNIAYVSWSDIGNLDFTISQSNIAGNIALDWSGNVYAVKKLRNRVVVYGTNGVSFLTPTNNTYGLNTLYRIGLMGKGAVAGDDNIHFFVDTSGYLIKLSDDIKRYNYSEYLSTLTSDVILSYDDLNKLLYICDGVKGYVFSEETESLGEGPISITSITNMSGVLYVGSPTAIINIPFEICTDIYDFGTRAYKTINSIELGTNLTEPLDVAIDYRRDKSQGFSQSSWHRTSPHGRSFIPAFGREFRFRVRIGAVDDETPAAYEYFELDYIKINGVVNDY